MPIQVEDGLKAGLSAPAAILLKHISFWSPKSKAMWSGKKWLARTRAELAGFTGLSPKQVRTALEMLKARGLIEVEQHIFQNRSQTFIRPLIGSLGKPGPSRGGPNGLSQVGPNGPCSIDTDGSTDGSTENSALSCASSEDHLSKPPSPKSEKKKTVAEVMAEAHKPSPKPVSLTARWLQLIANAMDKFVPPLTLKQQGQLKQFAKVCPPGKAEAIMALAVEQWTEFSVTAQSVAGLKTSPAQPDPGFLLKHAGSAVNFWQEHAKAKPVVAPVIAVTSPPKPSPSGKKKPSLEEVLAVFGPAGGGKDD